MDKLADPLEDLPPGAGAQPDTASLSGQVVEELRNLDRLSLSLDALEEEDVLLAVHGPPDEG